MQEIVVKSDVHVCKFCQKEFKRERTILTHKCKKRDRHNNRKKPAVKIGFFAYVEFFKVSVMSSKLKTMHDFIDSPYYDAFVKFGNYCISMSTIDINKYLDYLIRNTIAVDYWGTDKVYDKFLLDYLLKENPVKALERALEYSIEWSDSTKYNDYDILRKANDVMIYNAVTTGKLSPWVIYNSASGKALLANMDNARIKAMWDFIDPDLWGKVFEKYDTERQFVQESLATVGW